MMVQAGDTAGVQRALLDALGNAKAGKVRGTPQGRGGQKVRGTPQGREGIASHFKES